MSIRTRAGWGRDLESSDCEPKRTVMNALRALLDGTQGQVGKVNREVETLRKNQKETLQIKNTSQKQRRLRWAPQWTGGG